MEDIGITSLSEVRRREEVDLDENEGEKRQKLEEKQVITTTPPKLGDNTNNTNTNNGGLLDNLLAKLSSPKPASTPVDLGDFEDITDGGTGGGRGRDDVHVRGSTTEESGGGGGGVTNNIISSIFHKAGEGDDNVNGHGEKKESKVEVVNKDVVSDEGKTVINGGTIISNLVPDDVVPESDEASILILSVVHD